MTSAGSSGREERQLPPLLLPPTASAGQEDAEQSQALRMKVQALTVTALLLVLLSSAPAPSEAVGGRAGTRERQPGPGSHGEDPRAPGDGGDNLPSQGSEGSHPLSGAWEVMGEASPSSRSPSKAMAKPPLGSSKQDPLGKLRRLPRQPSRSRSPGLSHHLKGHGKFNGDTHSCHGIHSRPCQKPSDCGGCLGLYTCKLPAGTCDLKAVSRQRGGFLQSLQSPEGRRVLLILEQHGSR
ncbi:uncharacterized protein LOC141741553 [Larus michahellis]|uniref:uncharacterized protein LOC141741553 n=1 Tax=Larus michahellis TaxID=119627 RepID=UPI003D9B5F96